MARIYLLLGLLLLLIASFNLGNPNPSQHSAAFTLSQEVKGIRDGEEMNDEYPFLNEGLQYEIWPREEMMGSEEIPEGITVIVVDVVQGSDLYDKFGYFGQVYWVEGKLTRKRLRLIEYDLLTRTCLRELHVAISILNLISEQQVLKLGERLQHGWQCLRQMAYPPIVSEIHERFLIATEPAGWYLQGEGIALNTTMTYRALSETGVGGVRAYGYNSNSSTKLIYRATLELIDLLERNGIQPY
jgi:hypothetical protein